MAAVGGQKNQNGADRDTCRFMSKSIWDGQEWALHTLPCADECWAAAALLEEEEEAEGKWAEEGVSGVWKYSSKNSSIAASSRAILSFSSFFSVARHERQTAWGNERGNDSPHSTHVF